MFTKRLCHAQLIERKGGGRERERRGLKEIVYHNELVRLHDKKDFYRTVKLKIKAALF